MIGLPRVCVLLSRRRYEPRGATASGERTIFANVRLSSSTDTAHRNSMVLPMRRQVPPSYRRTRTRAQGEPEMSQLESTFLDDATAQELSERLADVFRTADVGDVLSGGGFLDGPPPLWGGHPHGGA